MTTTELCLQAFPTWLQALGTDAVSLALLLRLEPLPQSGRRAIAAALCYLYKSLDLIPDGIEDLGYMDDAFVLRVSCAIALQQAPAAKDVDATGLLDRLSSEDSLIRELLEGDYARLHNYVLGLQSGAARGRTVDEIVSDAAACEQFAADIEQWASAYRPPAFGCDDKTLVKLKAFLSAKLP